MKKRSTSTIAGAILMLGIACPAHAIPITLEFTVADIPPTRLAGLPPPTDTVSGVIVYEAAALDAAIDALISISLDIGSDSHTLAETSFLSPFGLGPSHMIGGLINGGVNAVTTHTKDFFLMFDPVAGIGSEFTFASSEAFGIWTGTNFSRFSLTATPVEVPEPPMLGLLVLGSMASLALRYGSPRRYGALRRKR